MPTSSLRAATAAGQAALTALTHRPAGAIVALDFDGTLAPIVDDPESSRLHAGADEAVRHLAAAGVLVTLLTGRPPQDAVRLSGLGDVPGLVVLGHYGAERWCASDGLVAPPAHPGVETARPQLAAIVAAAPQGVQLEDKGRSLAVHTRRSADPQGALADLRPVLARLADDVGLELDPGRLVLELRPPGVDKGIALCDLAAERGAHVVLFAGDDLGDLPAYDAVTTLRERGVLGVTVCSDSAETPVQLRERADLVVPGPAGVVALLAELAAQLRA
jgi:trehalose 6-phosphate phosphatase